MRKFNLTRREAEGFLKKSKDFFGLEQVFGDGKPSKILIFLAFIFGFIVFLWLYNWLTKSE